MHFDRPIPARGHRRRADPADFHLLSRRSTPCTPRHVRDTDWSQVVALYDRLAAIDPSPIVALNRAIAVAERDGPEAGVTAVDALAESLDGYHAFHATRAELLRRLGRTADALDAYDRAIELAGKRDGTLTALRIKNVANLGAYLSTASPGVQTILFGLITPGPYTIPHVAVETYGVMTNTTPTDAYRGAGRPEATSLPLHIRSIEIAA